MTQHTRSPTRPLLYTVGHSTRSVQAFLDLLQEAQVTAIADVRSQPYSRRVPHFNREPLALALQAAGIAYVFLGEELGARRQEPECYVDGQVDYDLVVPTPAFQAGLERLRQGMKRYRIALMCAEKDPLTCHRMLLLAKTLRSEMTIEHLLDRHQVELQEATERRLLQLRGLDRPDLFQSDAELLAQAYRGSRKNK